MVKKYNKIRKLKEDVGSNNEMAFFVGTGYAKIMEDSYEHGVGAFVRSFNIDIKGTYQNLQQIITRVYNKYHCVEDDIDMWNFSEESSCIATNSYVDTNIVLADTSEIEEWRRGETDLYACIVVIPIQIISKPRDMTSDDAKSLGLQIL